LIDLCRQILCALVDCVAGKVSGWLIA